jgi:hypothetical protein
MHTTDLADEAVRINLSFFMYRFMADFDEAGNGL